MSKNNYGCSEYLWPPFLLSLHHFHPARPFPVVPSAPQTLVVQVLLDFLQAQEDLADCRPTGTDEQWGDDPSWTKDLATDRRRLTGNTSWNKSGACWALERHKRENGAIKRGQMWLHSPTWKSFRWKWIRLDMFKRVLTKCMHRRIKILQSLHYLSGTFSFGILNNVLKEMRVINLKKRKDLCCVFY